MNHFFIYCKALYSFFKYPVQLSNPFKKYVTSFTILYFMILISKDMFHPYNRKNSFNKLLQGKEKLLAFSM